MFGFRTTLIDIVVNKVSTSSTRGLASTSPPNLPSPGTTGLSVASLTSMHLSGDGDLDLDTGLDVDNDLLDNLGGGVEAKRKNNSVSTSRL